MSDNNKDNDESEESDNSEEVTEISQMVCKSLTSNEIPLEEDKKKNQLIADISKTMKLLDMGSDDDIIVSLDEVYFRNDPKYTEIQGYIVGGELGDGMFSYVKEFVDKKSLKRFAAKVMDSKRIAKRGGNFLDNITIEINLVKKLNHKNVIHIHEFFSIEKDYYLILEYCYAVLSEYLDKEPKKLPKSQSHFYFSQLIDGLDYLHSIGIIHRDIKPQNILITPSNQIKITDFGVCYILDEFDESDMLTEVQGTPYYTAPEAVNENITSFSGTKYDIWSVGITLYQMVSGEIPFQECAAQMDFYDNLQNSDIQYPKVINGDKQLFNLLQEILVKDFNKRITIDEIRRHPHSQYDFRTLPLRDSGDIYRSLSVLPYIQSLYYPTSSSDEAVTKEEFEESEDRTPNIQNNRLSRRQRIRNDRRIPNLRRLVRLGLGIDSKNSSDSSDTSDSSDSND